MIWTVIFFEEGEEPLIEEMSSFSDAWALAQPAPEEMAVGWRTIITKQEVLAQLEADPQASVIVTHAPNAATGYNIIRCSNPNAMETQT